jgi:hypothetical protein
MASSFIHDPNADLDYAVNWTAWLDGDTIAASAWDVPTPLTSDQAAFTATTATVWVQGGTAGVDYQVRNRITTAAGRVEDRTITLMVREK